MDALTCKWRAYNQRTYRQHGAAIVEYDARKQRRPMGLEELKRRLLQEQERRRVG